MCAFLLSGLPLGWVFRKVPWGPEQLLCRLAPRSALSNLVMLGRSTGGNDYWYCTRTSVAHVNVDICSNNLYQAEVLTNKLIKE